MRRWIAALAVCLAFQGAALALYREWGAWKPGEHLSASFWPKGSDVLANRKERVGGHMLNSFDHFLYRGDTAALNAFLKDVENVQGSRSVMLLSGDQRIGLISPRVEGADWSLSISPNSHVGVFIPSDGRVNVGDMKFPADVELETVGDVGADVQRRVAEHEKRRDAAKAEPQRP
jgi:hypothetical protein